jgi:hypothetical protein
VLSDKVDVGKPQACTTTAAVGHAEPAREGWMEDWMNPGRERTTPEQDKRSIGRASRVRWKERWEAAQRSRAEAVPQPPCGKVLTLHRNLYKAESSLLVQLRTEKIGLKGILGQFRLADDIIESRTGLSIKLAHKNK